jgi:hypothetical protein
MNIRQKQVAAALAAVGQYLEEEQAALMTQAETAPRSVADPGFWAQAGRIEAMGVRRMMQMRVLARIQ